MHILKASSLAARGARAAALLVALVSLHAVARGVLPAPDYVAFEPRADHFPLVQGGVAAPLFVSEEDFAGVHTVAGHLQADIARVTGVEPVLSTEGAPVGGRAVLIGTLGRSPVLEQLVQDGKLDVRAVEGRWETFGLQVVEAPLPEVDEALVIFGSDKRGTIFGMYDLSAAIGVSPWSWWADTPVAPQDALFVAPGRHTRGEPKVKYRGIFINDEAPALTTWAEETFGGFNADFYARVFELLLRLRGNYLWPAMWQPAAFYEDDPENARLADELGVVIATSHHEPMMRAHDEWSRKDRGEWNYETNAAALREFWRGGIERMGGNESVVTVGMRGDGDHAMTEGTAIDLLEQIIADQREIIAEVTGRPPEETPQVWALYKEVQDYYDAGMRVPDDVMILLCDDNWGNIRVLPSAEERDHPGGFGLYYHFDFVGGPISYRWLNVTQIERVWEQMRLTYAWGVDELWLVNVGDIKPMELPTSFFLDLAWDPEAIGAVDLPAYYTAWAAQQ
ncbi:MAG: glycosyl hydrolase 115 family protein, partial [Opitutales bacterium]